MTDGVVKSLGVGRFLDWRTLEVAGAAGGVLVCWDKRSLELLEWEEGQFSVSCKFRTVENGTVWVFTGVYGPFNKKDSVFGMSLVQSGAFGGTHGVLGVILM